MEAERTKACRKCQVVKPFSDYYKTAVLKDGCYNICKECIKEAGRVNRARRKVLKEKLGQEADKRGRGKAWKPPVN